MVIAVSHRIAATSLDYLYLDSMMVLRIVRVLTMNELTVGGSFRIRRYNIGKTVTRSKQIVIAVDDLRFYSRELEMKEIQALNNDDQIPTRFFFD